MEEEAINYTSFLAMTLESKFYLTKERLWAAFKFFDVDNQNFITINSLREAMAREGRKLPESELNEIIHEVDCNNLGKISYQDFVNIMKADGLEEYIRGNSIISNEKSPTYANDDNNDNL